MADGRFGLWRVLFCPPGAPGPPVRTPVLISTKLTSRLSLAPCFAGQSSFGRIQAAPRRASLPLDSIRRRSSQAKTADLTTVRTAGLLMKLLKPFGARGVHSHEMARARLAKPDLLANEVTGGDLIGVLRTPSTARITRGKFGRMCTYLKAIIHLVSHSRPDIFQPPMREVARSTRWAYFGHPGMRCRKYVRPLFLITLSGDLNSRISQI
jgi:hypothetical protein